MPSLLYHLKSLYRRILFLEAASILKRYKVNNVIVSNKVYKIPCSFDVENKSIRIRLEPYSEEYCGRVLGLLYIDMNRDALVYLNGEPHYGYDKYHKYIPIDNPCRKNIVELSICTTTYTFGEHSDVFRINRIDYIIVLKDLWNLAKRLKYLLEVINMYKNYWIVYELSKILRETLDQVYVNSITPESLEAIMDLIDPSLGTYNELIDDLKMLLRRKKNELLKAGFREPDYNRLLKNSITARKYLDERLLELNRKYWREGTVYVISHAHIDAAWLWNWRETIEKIARTALNALYVLRNRNDLVFTLSSALYYKWLKDYHPKIYNMVLKAIKKGT